MKRRKTVSAELATLRDSFVKAVARIEADHVVRHMARHFGHLYAAGALAVQFEIVPWSEEHVMECGCRCFQAARREIKTESELLRRALLRLNTKAKSRTKRLDQHSSSQSLKNVDGYRRNEGKKKAIVTVRAEAFKRWFNDPRQPGLVLDFLRKNGRLVCSGSPGPGQGIKWAESQPIWPDGARVRSIVITFRPAF
jgi:hypothetical protein